MAAHQLVSPESQIDQVTKAECCEILWNTSYVFLILPESCYPPNLSLSTNPPVTSGGLAYVFKGKQSGTDKVCIKIFRTPTQRDLDIVKGVCDSVRPESEHSLITISVPILKSSRGDGSITKTWYRSSEFRKSWAHSALSPPGNQMVTSTTILKNIRTRIGSVW